MTFLPIVERELRVQARQKRTYRLRLGAAGVAIAMVSFMLLVNEVFSTPGSLGHGLFTVLAWLAFLYCLLSGVGNTADCLSEEKREGTLGLLFLTDLKGYDVVLGKLLATSLNNFYGLIAIFPPLAITLCLGGVTAGEFWRLVLLLTNTLFFSLAIGMFVSALSRDEQRAWAGALSCLVVLAAGPVLGFRSVFDTRYGLSPAFFWQGIAALQAGSWLLLALASAILPRAWQTAATDKTSPPARFFRSSSGERRQRQAKESDPIFWLARHQAGSTKLYLWIVVAVASGAGVLTILMAPGSAAVVGSIFGCAVGLHLLLAVWLAFQASYAFASARSSGTLEVLLSTPLTTTQIIEGYLRGLKLVFTGPVVGLLAAESVMVGAEVGFRGYDPTQTVDVMLVVGAGFCMVLLISDLFAVGRFGLWMGLKSKRPGQAFAKTVLLVMVLPVFSLFCCSVFTPIVLFVKNAILANYAQEQLRRHFRLILTEGGKVRVKPGRLPSVIEVSIK